jgi:curved DNA-binding protein CbpA
MRGLALLYHPDKGGQPEQMVVVNAAYAEAAQGALRASQKAK